MGYPGIPATANIPSSGGIGPGLRAPGHRTRGQHERGCETYQSKQHQNNQGEGVAQIPRDQIGHDDGARNGHAER